MQWIQKTKHINTTKSFFEWKKSKTRGQHTKIAECKTTCQLHLPSRHSKFNSSSKGVVAGEKKLVATLPAISTPIIPRKHSTMHLFTWFQTNESFFRFDEGRNVGGTSPPLRLCDGNGDGRATQFKRVLSRNSYNSFDVNEVGMKFLLKPDCHYLFFVCPRLLEIKCVGLLRLFEMTDRRDS